MTSHLTGVLSKFLRAKRIKAVKSFIYGDVLDLGCNSGDLSEFIMAQSYVGIDLDDQALAFAKNKYSQYDFFNNLNCFGNDIKFDSIAMLAVIEYFKDRVFEYRKLRTYLRLNGILIITTPNSKMLYLRSVLANLGLLANKERAQRINLPSIEEIKNDLSEAGFRIIHSKSFLFGMNQLFVAEINND